MSGIKVGVIGTGFIGPAHIEGLRRLGSVDVVAIAEAGDALAAEKTKLLHVPKAYGSWKQLLADKEIQAVHVCTPNNTHYEINKAALRAGKHVVSEKPLAMTSVESADLVALAKKTGLVNAVDFNYRFYPLPQHARAMISSGKVGDIYSVHGSYLQDWLYLDTDYNWRLEPDVGGESRAVADVGSHWCDLIMFLTGQTITRVFADLATIHKTRKKPKREIETYAGKMLGPEDYEPVPINTEDYATVLIRLDSGAVGTFTVSQVSAGRKNRLYFEIDGSKCALCWDQERPNEMWIGRREKPNELLVKDPSLLEEAALEYAHFPGGHPEGYPDGSKNFFRNVYRFIESGGRGEADFATFADGHKEICITESVLASAKSGAWVDVKY